MATSAIFTDDDFELDGPDFYLSGASADFDYESEWVNGPDHHGWEVTRVELVTVRLGGLNLTRYKAVDASSEVEISSIEDRMAGEIQEKINSGDLAVAAE